MKRILSIILPAIALATVVGGCGGDKNESKPVTVTGYTDYSDPVLKFAVRYPQGWAASPQQGVLAAFYSSSQLYDGFTRFEPKGERGAKILVGAVLGGEQAMDSAIIELKDKTFEPGVVKGPEATTLNGMTAKKLSYSFPLDETTFTAERWYVVNGDVVSYIETAVIGNYADYAAVFDSARASFHPGMVAAAPAPTDTTTAVRDSIVTDPPSATMKSYNGQGYGISYPENFEASSAGAGGAKASTRFMGARVDSYVQIDVIDPQGVTLDKIVADNKPRYGGRTASATTVGGQKAFVFSYSGGKDVSSRAYFLLGKGNLYRITMNWYKPQENLYQPAFEKMLSSFSLK